MFRNINKLIITGGCIILIAGCSKNSSHIVTPGGTVDISKSTGGQSDVKITANGKTAEYSVNKKVDLATLGVPIYPGAKEKEGGSVNYSAQENNKSSAMQSVALTSSDPFDKVSAFYKEQYKDKINDKKATTMEMGNGNDKMLHIMMNENKTSTAVVINTVDGKTQIQIIITKETK